MADTLTIFGILLAIAAVIIAIVAIVMAFTRSGPVGQTGGQGSIGPTGATATTTGFTGPTGIVGPTGAIGIGSLGNTGVQGPSGAIGPTGPIGRYAPALNCIYFNVDLGNIFIANGSIIPLTPTLSFPIYNPGNFVIDPSTNTINVRQTGQYLVKWYASVLNGSPSQIELRLVAGSTSTLTYSQGKHYTHSNASEIYGDAIVPVGSTNAGLSFWNISGDPIQFFNVADATSLQYSFSVSIVRVGNI